MDGTSCYVLERADHLDGSSPPVSQPCAVGLAELTLVEVGPGSPRRAGECAPNLTSLALLDERQGQCDAPIRVEALGQSDPLRDKAVARSNPAKIAVVVATNLEETAVVLDSPHATRMGTKNVSAHQQPRGTAPGRHKILSMAMGRTLP